MYWGFNIFIGQRSKKLKIKRHTFFVNLTTIKNTSKEKVIISKNTQKISRSKTGLEHRTCSDRIIHSHCYHNAKAALLDKQVKSMFICLLVYIIILLIFYCSLLNISPVLNLIKRY